MCSDKLLTSHNNQAVVNQEGVMENEKKKKKNRELK